MIAPLILFVLFVAGTYYIVYPFLKPQTAAGDVNLLRENHTALKARKISLLKQIREVEFENEMGLIAAEDYTRIRSELAGETGEILNQLDQIKTEIRKNPTAGTAQEPEARCPNCSAPVRSQDKFCGSCGSPLALKCPDCGADIRSDQNFCASCGHKIDPPSA